MGQLIQTAKKIERETWDFLKKSIKTERAFAEYPQKLKNEVFQAFAVNDFYLYRGKKGEEDAWKLGCELYRRFLPLYTAGLFAINTSRDFIPKDRRVFLDYLALAPLWHNFFEQWGKDVYPSSVMQLEPKDREAMRKLPHFKNQYTAIKQTRNGYVVTTFRNHPAFRKTAGEFSEYFREYAGHYANGNTNDPAHQKYFATLADIFSETSLPRNTALWRTAWKRWLALEGSVLTPLLLEETYDDKIFDTRGAPSYSLEIPDSAYQATDARLRVVMTELKKFWLNQYGSHSEKVRASFEALDKMKLRVMAPIVNVGENILSLMPGAYVQPNNTAWRNHNGFRCTLYLRRIRERREQEGIKFLLKFLDLFRGGTTPDEKTYIHGEAIDLGGAIAFAAHEGSHSFFGGTEIAIFEEPKATHLGYYGLAHLAETEILSEEEWHGVLWAILTRIIITLVKRVDDEGNLAPQSPTYPYQLEMIMLANRLVAKGALGTTMKEIGWKHFAPTIKELGQEFVSVLLGGNLKKGVKEFYTRPENSSVHPILKEMAVALRRN